MDLSYSAAEESFRARLCQWLEEHPPGAEPEGFDEWVAYGKAWQRQLYEGAWCGIHTTAAIAEDLIIYKSVAWRERDRSSSNRTENLRGEGCRLPVHGRLASQMR